jgi:polyisoprenoid-binding protein YceI
MKIQHNFADQAKDQPAKRRRIRHPLRWIVASVAGLIVIAVAAVGFYVNQPAPPPLALPHGAAAPVGPADGTWTVAGGGSLAGFRVPETALGFSNDVVGRTSAVTGTIVVQGDRVTAATFRVELRAIKVSGKAQRQVARSLSTARYPTAVFSLTKPVTLGPDFVTGATLTTTASGLLALNGTPRAVMVTITGRRSGSVLQVAGTIPVVFGRWHITGPSGFGFLGSLANHGIAEFLLILHRSPGPG